MNEMQTDGQLLQRYASTGDQGAFSEVVRRHQQLVFRVCRRVTGSNADAEDALQQVFVLLSEKAAALAFRISVAGWLYRTAWQMSFRYVRATKLRHRHEQSLGDGSDQIAATAVRDAGDAELAMELH